MTNAHPSRAIAALATLLLITTTQGAFFYSIDTTADELILIDTTTAQAISLGSLAEDLPDCDLAVADNRLYAAARFPLNELLEIDPISPAIVYRAPLPFLSTVKGLAADPAGQLHCGFTDAIHADPVLATLALDGTVTPTTGPIGYDVDGLCLTPVTAIPIAVDIATPNTIAQINPVTILDNLPAPANDVAATDTDFWALAADATLMRISRATGLWQESIQINAPGRTLHGLVLTPCIGDLDLNGATDVLDFTLFSAAFGATDTDPNYNPRADINNDTLIDVLDFGLFATDFGCPNAPNP